ncbi:putative alpha-ketoglutarate-dependent sulfonate dioxygenase [Calycina marina]|uniref:Alpha-ketoglutarate-dependent sulfonate dioxygenase n=1 Tax=Calycina marina TaxID=1763456 RepID=A0A9P7Z665_9HELO|nr:putative alpha-ketoglutarate-dependent sulfonate dioxygenase [Calycina marina]
MSPGRTDNELSEPKVVYDINLPYATSNGDVVDACKERTEFPDYLPVWEKGVWQDEVALFEFSDPALRADITKPNLFLEGVTQEHITPRMGTILTGVKLEELSKEGKDELALLICERKVVVLRNQVGFLKSGPQFQVDFMEHYGKLSIQPVSGHIKGFPQYHIIHRDHNEDEVKNFLQSKMTTALWHQDVSYEKQPPGYVMLGILACPDVGGDTVVCDTNVAYQRLSVTFQQMLSQVKVVHTSEKMINHVKASRGMVRSDPIDTIHPIIRVHPVTGEKALFLNQEFKKDVIGLKDMEADLITKFLMEHMIMGHDFQVRISWEKHSVVMFDGRSTLHSGTVDYDTNHQARHLFRLAAMTEVPIPDDGAEAAEFHS